LFDYPVVSKQLRDYYHYSPECSKDCSHDHHKKTENQQRQHCCGFNLIEHGVGHADLDSLLKNPQPLDFIFELIKVEQPGDYKKDAWALSEEEQIKVIPVLKDNGNELFKHKLYGEASEKYKEALGHLEQLMLKEKPNDVEWNRLNDQKIPILLNYSMCKFNLNEFYECIEHVNSILEFQPNHVKALFRRAKAYAAVYNYDGAQADFRKCVELDTSLRNEVNVQLEHLKKVKEKHEKEEKDKFRGKLFV
jgi:AH receptor-interacting protein